MFTLTSMPGPRQKDGFQGNLWKEILHNIMPGLNIMMGSLRHMMVNGEYMITGSKKLMRKGGMIVGQIGFIRLLDHIFL